MSGECMRLVFLRMPASDWRCRTFHFDEKWAMVRLAQYGGLGSRRRSGIGLGPVMSGPSVNGRDLDAAGCLLTSAVARLSGPNHIHAGGEDQYVGIVNRRLHFGERL